MRNQGNILELIESFSYQANSEGRGEMVASQGVVIRLGPPRLSKGSSDWSTDDGGNVNIPSVITGASNPMITEPE